jgi:hypothetical protein
MENAINKSWEKRRLRREKEREREVLMFGKMKKINTTK